MSVPWCAPTALAPCILRLIRRQSFEALFQEFCIGRTEGIVLIERLRIGQHNDTFLKMFELTAEEALTITPTQLVSDASSPALFGALTSATPIEALEVTGRRKKGTFPLEICVRPLPQRVLVFFKDLTVERQRTCPVLVAAQSYAANKSKRFAISAPPPHAFRSRCSPRCARLRSS